MRTSTNKDSPNPVFPVNTAVRFTNDALARMSPAERKKFENRTGLVTGYRMGAHDPIVTFPRDGRRSEQKLFEVASRRLEVVAATP